MKKIFTLFLLAGLCINAFAQWKPTNGLLPVKLIGHKKQQRDHCPHTLYL